MESSYKVRVTKEGEKRFRKLDRSVNVRILPKIKELANYKKLNNIKELKGELKGYLRYRVGNIRIVFEVDEHTKTVWVVDFGFRGSVYR